MTALFPALAHLPTPSNQRIAVHLYPAAERAVRQGHPWIFDGGIRSQNKTGQSGDLAVIFDSKERFLAIGLYDPDSPIRIKVLQHHQSATINRDWFEARIVQALARRASLATQHTNGYRLIYGENDGLGGLIVDRYSQTVVLKVYSVAWFPYLMTLAEHIVAHTHCEHIVLRLSRQVQAHAERYQLHDGSVIFGTLTESNVVFEENELRFEADVIRGHKTGFFFDQRENRQRVRAIAKRKTVLDIFAYVGAFSLYAADGGATHITSVDISAPAMAASRRNFELNQHRHHVANANHEQVAADAFELMQSYGAAQRQFDVVIVDPPSFAKQQSEVRQALNAYSKLTRLAAQLATPNGHLVMASCSSRVSTAVFQQTVLQALPPSANIAQLDVYEHAIDHPVGFPEGQYLKCLFIKLNNA